VTTPSTIKTQHHSEAMSSVAITALPTGPACSNMPTGESDNPSISVPSRVRERL
jgi:hypothetical protein